jgi:hypothetical protein
MRKKEDLSRLIKQYPYPRRRFIRKLLKTGIDVIAGALTKFEVSGLENLPTKGPFLIVGNHFHFLDTIGPIHATNAQCPDHDEDLPTHLVHFEDRTGNTEL